MKKLGWILAMMFSVLSLNAQQFKKKFILKLDEPLSSVQAEWIALDRDTLLDLVVTGIAADGQLKMITYQNEAGISLIKNGTQLTGFKNGTFQLADWSNDNRIDILIAGKTVINTDALFVFENKGDFTFQKSTAKVLDHASFFRVGDLNQDGRLDLITAGTQNSTSFLRVYKNTSSGLSLAFDTLGVKINDLTIFDFNKDGSLDFICSGLTTSLQPKTVLFLNDDEFKFKSQELREPVSGKLSTIDYNDDGLFDLFAVGIDAAGKPINKIWINKLDSFSIEKSYSSPTNAVLFTGDMNSNGFVDQLISGIDENGKSNFIVDSNEVITSLDTAGLIVQRMGDYDRDGDLDLVQVIDSTNQQWIKLYENSVEIENQRPGVPSQAFAISTFEKTFIYWQAPEDDHTASVSITYDVWLGTNQSTTIAPSFDTSSKRRMSVSHGNAGTNNFKIIDGLADERYFYQIQSVDNAYNGGYSICSGKCMPCFDLVHKDVQSCKNEEVTLVSASQAYWFSTSKGFLGKYDQFKFTAEVTDTIFSFVPQGLDCSKNNIWVIHVHDDSISETEIIYACEGKPIRLGISPGWSTVEWKTTPIIKDTDSINFMVTKPEAVLVTAKSQSGCTYQKEYSIRISKPELKLNAEQFQILKGNSVQLEAVSTASQFKWIPAEGLNNAAISNPIATPAQTTDYTLVATDSVGCKIEGRLQIQVQETAFVPNLFTPNGDGKNDMLLVYGLTTASSFSFQIYNREGNIVYETKDIQHASSSGWNGMVRGTLQPNGIYYWKVNGRTTNGEQLLLNGKKSGSILLVH